MPGAFLIPFWHSCQVVHITTDFYLLFNKGINLCLPFLCKHQLSENLHGLSLRFTLYVKLPDEAVAFWNEDRITVWVVFFEVFGIYQNLPILELWKTTGEWRQLVIKCSSTALCSAPIRRVCELRLAFCEPLFATQQKEAVNFGSHVR